MSMYERMKGLLEANSHYDKPSALRLAQNLLAFAERQTFAPDDEYDLLLDMQSVADDLANAARDYASQARTSPFSNLLEELEARDEECREVIRKVNNKWGVDAPVLRDASFMRSTLPPLREAVIAFAEHAEQFQHIAQFYDWVTEAIRERSDALEAALDG